MTVLLAELGRGQGRARRRRLGLALTAAAALAAGSFAVRHWQHTHQVAACEAAGGEIDAVWNDQTRQNVRDAFVATDLSFAASSADRVVSWIDRNTAAWRAARSESCLNVAVRDVWDRDTFERAVSCLDERRSAVESLLAEFVHPDSRTLQYAVTAAAGLVGVEGCLSREVLSVRSVPPAAHSGEIRAVRASLSRARSLGHVRKYSEALDVVARLYV